MFPATSEREKIRVTTFAGASYELAWRRSLANITARLKVHQLEHLRSHACTGALHVAVDEAPACKPHSNTLEETPGAKAAGQAEPRL